MFGVCSSSCARKNTTTFLPLLPCFKLTPFERKKLFKPFKQLCDLHTVNSVKAGPVKKGKGTLIVTDSLSKKETLDTKLQMSGNCFYPLLQAPSAVTAKNSPTMLFLTFREKNVASEAWRDI